ncbi:DUF1205 domain-containing protein [Streptomyces globisporus]|uniref:DUF1205 domain-containing protein n=1 Tax=Streptomyces globisporus TaxID=1908 RepID=A0A927GP90_STRGL|nr:DUF1205 domain-containing protein [Streptomyces globisporus]
MPAWLDEPPRRPRVALTLGVGGRGRQLFEEAGVTFAEVVAAITGLGAEVVATGHPGLPPGAEAPEGCGWSTTCRSTSSCRPVRR